MDKWRRAVGTWPESADEIIYMMWDSRLFDNVVHACDGEFRFRDYVSSKQILRSDRRRQIDQLLSLFADCGIVGSQVLQAVVACNPAIDSIRKMLVYSSASFAAGSMVSWGQHYPEMQNENVRSSEEM